MRVLAFRKKKEEREKGWRRESALRQKGEPSLPWRRSYLESLQPDGKAMLCVAGGTSSDVAITRKNTLAVGSSLGKGRSAPL